MWFLPSSASRTAYGPRAVAFPRLLYAAVWLKSSGLHLLQHVVLDTRQFVNIGGFKCIRKAVSVTGELSSRDSKLTLFWYSSIIKMNGSIFSGTVMTYFPLPPLSASSIVLRECICKQQTTYRVPYSCTVTGTTGTWQQTPLPNQPTSHMFTVSMAQVKKMWRTTKFNQHSRAT